MPSHVVKFTTLLILFICIASSEVAAQAQQPVRSAGHRDDGVRRLHLGLGAGLQQGIYAGMLWRIPLTSDGHCISPEATFGIRPGRWNLVGTAAMAWQYINIQRAIGTELKFKFSLENWKSDAEEVRRMTIGISNGVVMRYGGSLITLSVGPGIAFTNTTTESTGKTEIIDRNQFVLDLAAGITF